LEPGLSHWICTLFILYRSRVVSPPTFGEKASIVNMENARFTCCHPVPRVVVPLFLFDHCCPLVSTILMKNPVALVVYIHRLMPVAPVKSLYPRPPSYGESMDATAQPPPVVTADIDLVPACTVVAELAITRVEPPPVSAVDGFFRAPVSKSSNISAGIYGDAVHVGVMLPVAVIVAEINKVGVIVIVRVGVMVGE
jgi:hypothetical protein